MFNAMITDLKNQENIRCPAGVNVMPPFINIFDKWYIVINFEQFKVLIIIIYLYSSFLFILYKLINTITVDVEG